MEGGYPPFRLEDFYDELEIKLFERAQHDIEYKASGAVQAVLFARFQRPWQLLCEQAPDDSRRRVDIDARRGETQGGSLKDVELQGRDAGDRAIAEGCLSGIFIMTIWGLRFRVWYMSPHSPKLQPLFGSSKEANKEEYKDLRSYEGALELQSSISMIQGNTPLRVAPTVPSQPMPSQLQADWEQSQPNWGQIQIPTHDTYIQYPVEPDPGSSSAGADATSASKRVPIDTHGTTDELGSEESGAEDDIEPSEGEGKGKRKEKKREKGRREVKVKRVSGFTTKYEFTDAKGKTITTTKGDWVEKKSDGGRPIFEYRGKRHIYWCKSLK
ncbi:hypothetical protein MRS44_003794 [Fusarium solani]|uniref:uncharacterized protein n=1 Tax=Fusarium solani TaxID=169388 RepID=UPI0032C4A194|nr:hypothetical protein MRS44_003794 [Fusarium solani]